MAQPALTWPWPNPWTEADLRALPDDGHRYEILGGNLVITGPQAEPHQAQAKKLLHVLTDWGPSGWRVRWNIGLASGAERMIPDLLVLRSDSPLAESDYNSVDHIKVALVIEIESPSTALDDRGNKVLVYGSAGIPSYWRFSQNGVVHVYDHPGGESGYQRVRKVDRGEQLKVIEPFPVLIDSDALVS